MTDIVTNITLSQNSQGNIVDSDGIVYTNWPLSITAERVTVTLGSNLTFSNIKNYFNIKSDNFTFEGANYTITIKDILLYWGVVHNGNYYTDGYKNVKIQNLGVITEGSSTLDYLFGWIASSGKYSTITVTNCYSTGPIPESGGGILGGSACRFGTATVTNCYSTGNQTTYVESGGIFGMYAGLDGGTATATNCYSTGTINGGGIFGSDCGTVTATNCYSTGTIKSYGGGIFGQRAGNAQAINCYSKSDITAYNSGGIFGPNSGNSTARNCYSLGLINLYESCGGIFAPTTNNVSAINCYVVNGPIFGIVMGSNLNNYSQINSGNGNGSWSDQTASLYLEGTPSDTNPVGTIWTSISENTPFRLSAYTFSYNPTVQLLYLGATSTEGPFSITNGVYEILSVNDSTNFYNFSIDSLKGSITFSDEINPGSYSIVAHFAWTDSISYLPKVTIKVPPIITSSITLNQTYLETTDNWPIRIINRTQGSPIVVKIAGDATLSSNNCYFIIESEYITIDGGNHTLTITSAATAYPGLVQNGGPDKNGKSNLTIKNIIINGNEATLYSDGDNFGAGWFGHLYFGKKAINNVITNCSSKGAIEISGGGIIGSCAGASGELKISNCFSIGQIEKFAGGIVGTLAAIDQGVLAILNCFSSGSIYGIYSGGIIGSSCGTENGEISICESYSTGEIFGSFSGGITGDYLGYTSNKTFLIKNCYSNGNVTGSNAGGICGGDVGFNNGSPIPKIIIENCYAWGKINTTGGGILGGSSGDFYSNTNVSITNCYTLYGSLVSGELNIYRLVTKKNSYEARGTWSNSTANTILSGTPSEANPYGTIWTNVGNTNGYFLSAHTSSYKNSSLNVSPGTTTISGPHRGGTYQILTVNGLTISSSFFTINSSTGAITVSNNTPTNRYTIVVFYQGSYYFLTLNLTVEPTPSPPSDLPCLLAGMRISTPFGDMPVEELQEGDLVLTSRGRSSIITKVMTTMVIGDEDTLPYIIKKNSMGPNQPRKDIYLSKNHEYYYRNKWRVPGDCGLERRKDLLGKEIVYYHIKTENYDEDKLRCEGIIVDSWKD